MYAIVEIAGQQFKVAKNQKVFVHRLQEEEGSNITFDNVLLLDDGKVTLGAPAIEGAAVTAKILKHLKGDKVIVFKKKRRKGYKVKNGHRQYLSEIQIESIVATGAVKQPKKEEPKKETPKKVKTKKVAEPKVAAAPKPAAKKAPAKTASADDLKKVEGIGPKIAELFVEAGIDTFAKLAKASQKELNAILEAAGSRYASHNPGSWPKQAKMAAEGKWDELQKWQDETKGGIEE